MSYNKPKGIVCYFRNKFYKIGAYKVREVKNTTGAGDLVAAWLIYGLIKKMDVKDILNFASVAGAFHVKKDYIGATLSYRLMKHLRFSVLTEWVPNKNDDSYRINARLTKRFLRKPKPKKK